MITRKILPRLLPAVLGLTVAGCSPQEPEPAPSTAPAVAPPQAHKPIKKVDDKTPIPKTIGKPSTRREITFRHKGTVGRKLKAEWVTTREDGTVTPLVVSGRSVSELVSVKNGNSTWKVSYTEKVNALGDHEFAPGKGVDENRLEFYTYNAIGNLVGVEGHAPDSYLPYKQFPERRVRIGDTWSGYTVHEGDKSRDSYKLEEISIVKGNEYAVVSYVSKNADGTQRGKKWVDAATGIPIKSVENGDGRDFQDELFRFSQSYYVLDNFGQRILP